MRNRLFIALSLFLMASYWASLFSQNVKIDSMRVLLKSQAKDTNRINTLNELGWELHNRAEYAESMSLLLQALKLSEKLNYKKGAALAHDIIGLNYFSKGNFPEALRHFLIQLKLADEIQNKKLKAYALGNMGIVHLELGNYAQSLELQKATLEIFREIKSDQGVANCYGNMGDCQTKQKYYSEALKNYFASLKMLEKLKDSVGISTIYANIGSNYFEQSVSTTCPPQDRNKLFVQAVNNYFSALNIQSKIGDLRGAASTNNLIAAAYLHSGMLKEAEIYTLKAMAVAKNIGSKSVLAESILKLSKIESTKNNFQQSYMHYKQYIVYRDSLVNEENKKQIIQSQLEYTFGKQQMEDSIQNAEFVIQESLKHEESIQQQRMYTWGGGIGFLLMLVIAGASFKAYREKHKANSIIMEQKQLVEFKQKEILDSINYAKKIQLGLLPTEKYIRRNLDRMLYDK